MSDLARIKNNVRKMVEQDAPPSDIDAYISSEGVTLEQVRAFRSTRDQQQPSVAYDMARQFGENFNRGLYATINAPTSLANMAMSATGMDYRFKRPLEAAVPKLDQMILETPEPQTAAGEVTGTVAEYVGANALPAGGMIAAAPRLAAATANASTLGGQVVNRMASGVAAAPGTAAAGELVSTVGAGLGAQVGKDLSENNPTAEFIGATLGGIAAPMAMAVSPTNMARKGVSAARKRLSPQAMADAERRAMSAAFRENLTPEARANINDTAAIQRDVPNYKPTVAEATETPSLIATQRAYEQSASGRDLDNAIRRYQLNDSAVADAVVDHAPSSAMTLDDAFAQAGKRPKRIVSRIEDQLAQLDDAALANSDISSGASRAGVGQTVRSRVADVRANAKDQMSNRAHSLGLNDARPLYRFDDQVKARLLEAVQPRSQLADRAALPNNIAADIQRMGNRVSVDDLMALRSRIGDDIRTHSARPDGKRRVEHLQRLQSQLDAVADTILREAGDGNVANAMKQFRAEYRETVIEPFEQGAAAKVLKKDLAGAYRVPDEEVASEFFNGWNQTAARQFREIFPSSDAATTALEKAALDDLYSSAVLKNNTALSEGVLDPKRIRAWIRRNEGVLREYPQIMGRVQSVDDAISAIARRRATLLQRRRSVETNALSRELARVDDPLQSLTPEAVIEASIKNAPRMRKIMQGMRSKDARDAIARQVWETALEQPQPSAFIKRNSLSLRYALGDKFDTMSRLARAIEKNKLVPRPSGQPLDSNPVGSLEGVLGTGLNQISSRVFAVNSGRTSARYALADIAGRAFRQMSGNQARKTLQAAIYDPQVAVDLANALELGTLGKPSAVRRLYSFMLANGILATDEEGATREQP